MYSMECRILTTLKSVSCFLFLFVSLTRYLYGVFSGRNPAPSKHMRLALSSMVETSKTDGRTNIPMIAPFPAYHWSWFFMKGNISRILMDIIVSPLSATSTNYSHIYNVINVSLHNNGKHITYSMSSSISIPSIQQVDSPAITSNLPRQH
jgi:hypothetical protein